MTLSLEAPLYEITALSTSCKYFGMKIKNAAILYDEFVQSFRSVPGTKAEIVTQMVACFHQISVRHRKLCNFF